MTQTMVDQTRAEVVNYRSPSSENALTAYVGMIVFLGSWFMLFAGLFFTYGGLRLRADVWPPVNMPALPLDVGWFNSVLIVLSSCILLDGQRLIRSDKRRLFAKRALVATVLGLGFLMVQLYSWIDLYGSGLTLQSGAYGSIFYTLTTFHGLHVAIGIVALAGLTWKGFRGQYNAARHTPVRLWSIYWHFVGAIWLFLFWTVYLV